MKTVSIRGYTDRPSVAPGETIKVFVSADRSGEAGSTYDAKLVRLIHGDTNPKGPGYKEEEIESSLEDRKSVV